MWRWNAEFSDFHMLESQINFDTGSDEVSTETSNKCGNLSQNLIGILGLSLKRLAGRKRVLHTVGARPNFGLYTEPVTT
jgi:hypothetical protein